MGDAAQGAELLKRYALSDWPHLPDAERRWYAAFGLGEGGAGALFGAKSLVRGISTLFRGNLPHEPVGNVWQMPGAFVLDGAGIAAEFRHAAIADQPDYLGLLGA